MRTTSFAELVALNLSEALQGFHPNKTLQPLTVPICTRLARETGYLVKSSRVWLENKPTNLWDPVAHCWDTDVGSNYPGIIPVAHLATVLTEQFEFRVGRLSRHLSSIFPVSLCCEVAAETKFQPK